MGAFPVTIIIITYTTAAADTLEKSSAQDLILLTRASCLSDSIVEVTKKCFSRRLISGVGNSS